MELIVYNKLSYTLCSWRVHFDLQVDSLDMLALLGDRTRFSEGVSWLGKNLSFDKVFGTANSVGNCILLC
jgi:hypothetical protein